MSPAEAAAPAGSAARAFGHVTAVVAFTIGMMFQPESGLAVTAPFLVYGAAMPVAIEARQPAVRGVAVVVASLAGLASFLLLTVGIALLTGDL